MENYISLSGDIIVAFGAASARYVEKQNKVKLFFPWISFFFFLKNHLDKAVILYLHNMYFWTSV